MKDDCGYQLPLTEGSKLVSLFSLTYYWINFLKGEKYEHWKAVPSCFWNDF